MFESSNQALELAGLRRETIDVIKSSEPREKAVKEIEELARLGGEALILSDRDILRFCAKHTIRQL